MKKPLSRKQAAIAPLPAAVLRDEDRRIMALAASMDPVARRTVAVRLFERVQGLVRMLFGDAPDAEDAVQLSLLEILRSAGGYRGESSLEHWADRVTVRTALRAARKQRQHASRIQADADLESLPEPDPGELDESEVGNAELLLARLSPPLREVVVLRHVLGHSVPESAVLLGVSPNTVKDRLVRARSQLRRLVRREHVLRAAKTGAP